MCSAIVFLYTAHEQARGQRQRYRESVDQVIADWWIALCSRRTAGTRGDGPIRLHITHDVRLLAGRMEEADGAISRMKHQTNKHTGACETLNTRRPQSIRSRALVYNRCISTVCFPCPCTTNEPRRLADIQPVTASAAPQIPSRHQRPQWARPKQGTFPTPWLNGSEDWGDGTSNGVAAFSASVVICWLRIRQCATRVLRCSQS
jgi:hypothetical protein